MGTEMTFHFMLQTVFPQLLQRMCPDSKIAKGVKMSHTKVSYVMEYIVLFCYYPSNSLQ